MAVDVKTLSSIQAYQKSAKLEHFSEKTDALKNRPDLPDQASPEAQMAVDKSLQTAKIQQQASIVTHLFTQGSEEEVEFFSLKMTYQSAIEAINERLRADLGLSEEDADPVSQETLDEQGGMEYWTPENTAQRIVSGATAFLGGFQNAHPELQGEALMDHFMDVVGGGLIKGFEEAKGILSDLKVFEGEVESNYQATYDLVQQGMEQFRKDFLSISDTENEKTAEVVSPENTVDSTE